MDIQFWKPICGFENHYIISNIGNVKSLKTQKILKTFEASGYYKVSLCKNGKVTKHFIHRLVAKNFLDNPLKLRTVNHKDGNRKNNNINNLEWYSYKNQELHKNRVINKRKRGVFKSSKNTWQARIKNGNKYEHLGCFYDKEKAYDAYYCKYIEIYGIKPW